MEESSRSKKILLATLIVLVLLFSIFVSLKLDHNNRSTLFQNFVRDNPNAMEAFERLKEVTPENAVIFSWWDYGRAIEEFGHRKAVVAYASKEMMESVGESRNPIHAFEMQLFGKFETHERIKDVARAFLLPEGEALTIMRKYGANYVMVFCEEGGYGAFDDLYKLPWIAKIAGYNITDYLTIIGVGEARHYILGPKAEGATILRLIYDEQFHPRYFTKIFENEVAKIYKINYME